MENLNQTEILLRRDLLEGEEELDKPAPSRIETFIDKIQSIFTKKEEEDKSSITISESMFKSFVGPIPRESHTSRDRDGDIENQSFEEAKRPLTYLDAQFMHLWNVLINNMGFPREKVNRVLTSKWHEIGGNMNTAVELIFDEPDEPEEEKFLNTSHSEQNSFYNGHRNPIFNDSIGKKWFVSTLTYF
jgi:hypothetical protein